MAGNCPECGRYLGASNACPECDGGTPTPFVPPTTQPLWFPDEDGAGGAEAPIPRGSSSGFTVRGIAVEGSQVRRRLLPGAMLLRVLLALAWVGLVYLKAQDILAAAFWQLFWMAFPFLVIWMLLVAFAGRFGLGGCLAVPFTLGAGLPRGTPRDDGWDLVVMTSEDAGERVAVAGDLPIQPDHELVVHGPRLGDTRHAWVVQGVAPTTFTRVSRGLVGTVLLAAVILPQLVWLLLR